MWLLLIIIIVVLVVKSKNKADETPATVLPKTEKDVEQKIKLPLDKTNADNLMALAEQYAQDKDNEESLALAWEYTERAADAGHPDAIAKTADVSYKLAALMIDNISRLGRDASMEESIEKAYDQALRLVNSLQKTNGSKEAKQAADDRYIDTIVWLSSIHMLDKNYDEIFRITKNVPSPFAKAYLGRALYEFSKTEAELDNAISLLKNFMHPAFLSGKYSTPKIVYLSLIEPRVLLASMYRTYYKDINSAYNVFSTLIQHEKDPEALAALQDDISHYRQLPSGDYEYIE